MAPALGLRADRPARSILPQTASTKETRTMLFQSWLRTLRSVLTRRGTEPRRRRTPHPRPTAGFRPRLEALEDRCTPAQLTVTTLSDLIGHSGVSLRDAIATANADAQAGTADTIVFDSGLAGGTIALAQGQLELSGVPATGTALIKIDASALAGGVTVDGQGAQRILYVGATAELDNLTLKNGNSVASTSIFTDLGGGAIYNVGWVTLSGCHLTGNYGGLEGLQGGSGGAIDNHGTMIINNSFLTGNSGFSDGSGNGDGLGGVTRDGGGAIENYGGSLTINGGALSGNTSDAQGGAIFNYRGSLTVSGGVTLSGNTALAYIGWGPGGGICNVLGTVTITDSTLSGNTAAGNGGAIATFGGSVTMTNCTVGGATSADGNTAQGDGGGIYNNGGTVTLNAPTNGDSNPSILSHNSANRGGAIANIGGPPVTWSGWTLSGNTGYVDGGGVFIDPAVVTIISCTFTGNTAPAGADLYNLDSSVTLVSTDLNGVANNGGTITLIGSSVSGVSGSGGTVTDPIADLIAQVAALNLNSGQQNSLISTLQAAEQSLLRGHTTPAVNQLNAFTNQVNALVNSHRLSDLTADDLDSQVDDLVQLLG
jgi:hypothetical protein